MKNRKFIIDIELKDNFLNISDNEIIEDLTNVLGDGISYIKEIIIRRDYGTTTSKSS